MLQSDYERAGQAPKVTCVTVLATRPPDNTPIGYRQMRLKGGEMSHPAGLVLREVDGVSGRPPPLMEAHPRLGK